MSSYSHRSGLKHRFRDHKHWNVCARERERAQKKKYVRKKEKNKKEKTIEKECFMVRKKNKKQQKKILKMSLGNLSRNILSFEAPKRLFGILSAPWGREKAKQTAKDYCQVRTGDWWKR